MIEQNGHAVTTVLAPVARSCLKRTSLMREPGSSSLSANSSPPPAPHSTGCRDSARARDVGAETRQQVAGSSTRPYSVRDSRVVVGDRSRAACDAAARSRVSSSTNTDECTISTS